MGNALTFKANEPLAQARGMLDPLRTDLNWVHLHRKLFWAVVREIDRNAIPKSPTWRAHYARLYVDGQSIAVRRLIGGARFQRDEASLTRLLSLLRDNASTITIDRLGAIAAAVASATRPEDIARHRDAVERHWGDGSGVLDASRIESDLAKLAKDTAQIRKWATKTVAHLNLEKPDPPSFGKLDEAVTDATGVFRSYGILLAATDYAVDETEPDLGWWVPLHDMFADRPVDP
jgi:hypothetical protein